MVRYTLLRFLIFFGCLALLWLLGLRDGNELPWLVVIAALASMVISAIVLRPFRVEMVEQIQARQAAKARARSERTDTDEAVEDAARGSSDEGPESYR
ncbi:DUF4229 domain-containing protein [Janibacter terrae]|jgi:mannitol-specific phosphotransferase system IIBC component|uniref:DUF4229 domain-containing protein n=1 Tax=Janibacter terrae TaxID=103817 RepID=A0ABZ2FF95_9MICO|nr:DUF4229 domain-containing protein [Janibacter terrae]MBA4084902.1 DUF4229 domain-containing protein [Kytococcus sp.]HCE60788.1 DUF4229 domain-containing protein [Janibacter terrae]